MKLKKLGLDQRQERILLSLKKFDFLTRDQIGQLHSLGSVRNINKIMKNLENYVTAARDGFQSVYYLSKQGREYVNCNKIRKYSPRVQHTVIRNQMYFHEERPVDWRQEVKVSVAGITVIADALYRTKDRKYKFLEVDLTQSMAKNRAKVQRYRALYENGALEKKFGEFPVLVWVTTTEYRKKQLESLCQLLPHCVYTLNDIQ
jgi:hypothetical protein